MKSSIPQKHIDSGHSMDVSCISSAFTEELDDVDDDDHAVLSVVDDDDSDDDELGAVEEVQGKMISQGCMRGTSSVQKVSRPSGGRWRVAAAEKSAAAEGTSQCWG